MSDGRIYYFKKSNIKNEDWEKMTILEKELFSVTEQMFDNFEKSNINFRGTWLEEPIRHNVQSLYLQCKYVKEELGKDIIIAKEYDSTAHSIVERMSKIIQKILWKPSWKNYLTTNPSFEFGNKKEELSLEEYIDILLQVFSACFEFYVKLLKNKEMFDCIKLARKLSREDLIDKIDNDSNLNELYKELKNKTENKYNYKIASLYNVDAYKVRCSCFHVSYSYKKEKDYKFSIVLNKEGTEKIEFSELLALSNDIFAKLNVFGLIPYYFKENKLPAK